MYRSSIHNLVLKLTTSVIVICQGQTTTLQWPCLPFSAAHAGQLSFVRLLLWSTVYKYVMQALHCDKSGADWGEDGVATHPPFTCLVIFVQGIMWITMSLLAAINNYNIFNIKLWDQTHTNIKLNGMQYHAYIKSSITNFIGESVLGNGSSHWCIFSCRESQKVGYRSYCSRTLFSCCNCSLFRFLFWIPTRSLHVQQQ